jgi:hypothetical protein
MRRIFAGLAVMSAMMFAVSESEAGHRRCCCCCRSATATANMAATQPGAQQSTAVGAANPGAANGMQWRTVTARGAAESGGGAPTPVDPAPLPPKDSSKDPVWQRIRELAQNSKNDKLKQQLEFTNIDNLLADNSKAFEFK